MQTGPLIRSSEVKRSQNSGDTKNLTPMSLVTNKHYEELFLMLAILDTFERHPGMKLKKQRSTCFVRYCFHSESHKGICQTHE